MPAVLILTLDFADRITGINRVRMNVAEVHAQLRQLRRAHDRTGNARKAVIGLGRNHVCALALGHPRHPAMAAVSLPQVNRGREFHVIPVAGKAHAPGVRRHGQRLKPVQHRYVQIMGHADLGMGFGRDEELGGLIGTTVKVCAWSRSSGRNVSVARASTQTVSTGMRCHHARL